MHLIMVSDLHENSIIRYFLTFNTIPALTNTYEMHRKCVELSVCGVNLVWLLFKQII